MSLAEPAKLLQRRQEVLPRTRQMRAQEAHQKQSEGASGWATRGDRKTDQS